MTWARDRRTLLTWALLAVAVVAALASVYVGGTRALTAHIGFGSTDFQWSPTRLFLHGVDPYAARLAGSDDIILTQTPNYLQLLYLVLTPFGLLSFTAASACWLVLNVALAVGLGIFYARVAGLGRTGTTFLVAGFLASTPMRISLSVGQHAVFLLVFATLAFAASQRPWAGAPLAVALTKYSFAPLGLVLLVLGRIRTLVVAGVVLLAAAALFAWVTSTSLLTVLSEPFQLSRNAVGPGVADLMTVLTLTPWFDGKEPALTAIAVLAAVALTLAAARRIRSGDWVYGLAVGAVVSLLCFKHLSHDLVFLLPVVVVALGLRGRRAVVVWAVLAWFGFGAGILSQAGIPVDTPAIIVISFTAMAVLLGALTVDAPAVVRRAPVRA